MAGTNGGTVGDAAADTITVNGTAAPDTISVTANILVGIVFVTCRQTVVRITSPEMANDSLIVNGLGGIDTITTGSGVTGLIGLTVNP